MDRVKVWVKGNIALALKAFILLGYTWNGMRTVKHSTVVALYTSAGGQILLYGTTRNFFEENPNREVSLASLIAKAYKRDRIGRLLV